jgi:hypothetical protein
MIFYVFHLNTLLLYLRCRCVGNILYNTLVEEEEEDTPQLLLLTIQQ